ncbi:MAG: hypothetical protein AAGL10_12030 [Pseudomonadota bacterium]
MRILFYLPVVTPWWFKTIVLPLIEKLESQHEVHVLTPAPWKGTGLDAEDFAHCAHLPKIRWHIVNDVNHPSLRTDPVEREAIIAFVHSLEPDFVLCRSADLATTKAFPGVVKHITEAAVDPLALSKDAVHFTEQPFDHGLVPDLNADAIADLHTLIAPFWPSFSRVSQLDQAQQQHFDDWADLPKDRKVLLLPLEYEHEENFFIIHRVGDTPNAQYLAGVLEQLDDRFFLAVTNHPLNELHVDNSALEKCARAHSSRMRLYGSENPIDARTTQHLLRQADGVLLGDSKCFSMAGFLSTPIYRQSRFETGEWLNAYDDLELFLEAVAQGDPAKPDSTGLITWLAFHAANNLLDPNDPKLTAADLLDRLENPVNPD